MKDEGHATEKGKHGLSENGMPDASAWIDGYNRMLSTWSQSGAGMFKGATEISREIMSFSQNRFQASMDAWQAVSSCRTPQELFDRQTQILRDATADYLEEAKKLTSQTMSLVDNAVATFQQQIRPNP